jgi:hypothetical protein
MMYPLAENVLYANEKLAINDHMAKLMPENWSFVRRMRADRR